MEEMNEIRAEEELKKGYEEAENILKDEDKLERLLQRLEKKLKIIPVVGGVLSEVPIMASLIKSYIKKEYTEIPIGTMIAVVSAIAYFVSPVDIIPDIIPGAGYIDDAAVIAVCWNLVETDVKEYAKWRKDNGLEIE